MGDEETQMIAGAGTMDAEGNVKSCPFSVFIGFKENDNSPENIEIGGKLAKEFLDMIGDDAEGLPDCVESVTIKRSVDHGKETDKTD